MVRLFAFLCCTVFLETNMAAAQQPPEFIKAYQNYVELMKQGNAREAIPHAKAALDIALKSDAFDDESRARLAFNLGYTNLQDNQLTASTEAFTLALDLFDKAGKGSSSLKIDALIYRGICYRHLFRNNEAAADLKQALGLLTGDESAVQLVRADASENLAWVEIAERRQKSAQKYATQAHEIYSKLLTERHPRTLRALIAVSASAYLAGRQATARNILAHAIELAEKADVTTNESKSNANSNQFTYTELMTFHRNVATFYKLMGRDHDAEYHRNIARDLRKGIPPANLRVKPIRRWPPAYPRRAANRGISGWAIMEYTVRRDGSTADIRVIDAGPKGYFEKASINAVERWKFKPPVEAGKPVDIKGIRTCILFKLKI